MNKRDTERAEAAFEAAAARTNALVGGLSDDTLSEDFAATLSRVSPDGVADTSTLRRWIVIASSAAAVAAIAVGIVVLTPSSDVGRLRPALPRATDASPSTVDETPATTLPASHANPPPGDPDETRSPTSTAPPTDFTACLPQLESARSVNAAFVDQMLAARTSGGPLPECIGVVPALFDGLAPNCWTDCEGFDRTFADRAIGFGEFFSPPSNEPRFTGSIPVSYRSGGEFVDAIERWEVIRDESGWRVENFTMETSPVERIPAADVINRYFATIANGDWAQAADFFNDGGLSAEDRPDLQRLAPSSFEQDNIAAALEAWCADGCDTGLVEPGDLEFDGGYRLVRRGHSIRAAWFEGTYSISGLPFRGDGSTGPETFTADDLVVGVELAIDGTGLDRAVLFEPDSLNEADAAALDAVASGDFTISTADEEFDQVWLFDGDPWCSRRPVVASDVVAPSADGSVVNIWLRRPARFETSEAPSCVDIDVLAIGFDWVDSVRGFSSITDSVTPITDADSVTATPDGLVLDSDRGEFSTPIGTRFGGVASLVDDSIVWQESDGGPTTIITDTNIWSVDDSPTIGG